MKFTMKKTLFLKTLMLSAATVALFGMTACSGSDDNIIGDEPITEQPGAVKTYQVSIPATMPGDEQTRAVSFDANGTDITTTFKTTDKIYAYNETKTAWSRDYSDWVTLTPSANAKQTELNGTLAFARWNGSTFDAVTPEVGDVIHLFYNISNPDFSPVTSSFFDYGSQTGSASSASAHDYAKTTMKIKSIEGSNITLCQVDDDTKLTASFQNMQSMFRQRLTFTDKNAATVTPTIISLEIKSKNNKLIEKHFPFENDKEANRRIVISNPVIDANGDIYLALRFDGSDGTDALTFTAQDSDGNIYECTKNAPGGGFQNGKYYHGAMTMAFSRMDEQPIVEGTNTAPDYSLKCYKISDDPTNITISGSSAGWCFWLKEESTVTLNNATGSRDDNNLAFITCIKSLNLIVNGTNNITCKNTGQCITCSNDEMKLSGNGTLTVTSYAMEGCGIFASNYEDSNNNYATTTEVDVTSLLAADGYTVTRSARTNNGDGTYTWTYTVAQNNN